MPVNPEIEKYVTAGILPRYRDFDAAHNTGHVTRVIEDSLRLAPHFSVSLDMVYIVAAYHDLGLAGGRENHHKVSAEMLRADVELQRWFTAADIDMMAEAIEDHRASSSGEPRSIYGKIVAEADRDIEPITVLRRAVQYGLNKFPGFTKEEQYARFCSHMDEKYAEGGYMKLWIPFSRNAKGLAALRVILKDDRELQSVFDTIYNEESHKIGRI